MWGLVSWLKVDEIYKFTTFKCSQRNIYVQKLHFLSSSLLQKRSVTLDTFARSDSELWIDSLPRLLYNVIMTYNDTVTCNSVIANGSINFTYDCWEMFRLATSRPLGERSEPILAANRPTASDEVARGRLVSLDGFPFAFRAKNGEWRDSHLGLQVSFASPWLQWRNLLISLRLNLLNVCVYLHHRRTKFVYFVRKLSLTMILGESWRPQGAGKKQKLIWNPTKDFFESLTRPQFRKEVRPPRVWTIISPLWKRCTRRYP